MIQTMTESRNFEWHKILVTKLDIESSLLLTKLDLNFSLIYQNRNSRMSSKNFYTFASIRSRKAQNNQWNIRKILIDFENTLNLISQRVARQIDCLVRENKTMTMIIANDVKVSLSKYTIIKIIVTRVTRVMQFFVISRKTFYSIILKRLWIRDIFAINYYEIDEYWIKSSKADYYKLKIFDSDSTRAMKIYMRERRQNEKPRGVARGRPRTWGPGIHKPCPTTPGANTPPPGAGPGPRGPRYPCPGPTRPTKPPQSPEASPNPRESSSRT